MIPKLILFHCDPTMARSNLTMTFPNLEHEIELWERGFTVIGIDEVGRGAFAGPLYVGGVIFPPTTNDKRITKLLSYGINDSKKLTPTRRELLAEIIQKESLAYSLSKIEVAQINRIGIGKATFCAMRETVGNLTMSLRAKRSNLKNEITSSTLSPRDDKLFALIDGFNVKYMKGVGLKNQRSIIRGDSTSLSIAAASIIAKVARDAHMRKLSIKFPAYAWSKNKGYGTREHRLALSNFGATALHRTDFIANYI